MSGKVYIIGVGPGAVDLLTLRAIHAIRKSDIVIYDALINPQIIDMYCRDKMKIFVGKRLGEDDASTKQKKIHQMLLGFARGGKIVARLKNGDPLIFARGAEEAEELKKFNIPYEYIPGITAISGAASYASIPLTHRRMSSKILITTGHFVSDKSVDEKEKIFKYLAGFDDTIAIYMGSENLKEIVQKLIMLGKKDSTYVAIISNATVPTQKVYISTLGEIVTSDMVIKRPAVLLIGDVVSLQSTLDWRKTKPLLNKLFIITRPIENSISLNMSLIEEGAATFLFPLIQYEILPISRSQLKKIPQFSWIIFKSQFAVKVLFETLLSNKMDLRCLKSAKIAAIGNVTANRLKEFGIVPDLVPSYYNTECLTKQLINKLGRDNNVLICSANIRNKLLEKKLKEKNVKFKLLTLYKIDPPPDSMLFQKWEELKGVLSDFQDVNIIFASSQTVKNFFDSVSKFAKNINLSKWNFYSIGNETTSTLKQFGVINIIESKLPAQKNILEEILSSRNSNKTITK